MPTIILRSNSWITLADAETYFGERLNTVAWDDAETSSKQAALIQAYRELIDHPNLIIADTPTTTALERGQCEHALWLISDEGGVDARLSLRGQGVTQSGVVKESYTAVHGHTPTLPVAPAAWQLLADYQLNEPFVGIAAISRDDDA